MAVSWTYWPSDPYWSDPGHWDTRPPWVRPARPGTMAWSAVRSAEPILEPIDLAYAKLHLRIDTSDEDALVGTLLQTARDYVERATGRALLTQTWTMVLDRWPRMDRLEYWPAPGVPYGAMLLPVWPVQTVTSIIWQGTDGSNNTVNPTTYTVDTTSRPARISPVWNQAWAISPALVPQAGIQVSFVAGHTTWQAIPPTLRQAMLLLVGHWYENREEIVVGTRITDIQVPMGAVALISQHQPPLVG